MSMSQAKRHGHVVTLTADDVLEMWQNQSGRCFYTDYELIVQSGQGVQRHSLSFDRIVPEDGYTKDNVVLCTRQANAVKQDLTLEEMQKWLPGWYERINNRKAQL